MSSESNKYQLWNNNQEEWILNFFWLGFVLYTSAYTISTSAQVNYILCYLIQSLGLVLLVPSAFLLIKLRFDTGYLMVIFSIYILWQLSVVIRGFLLDIDFLVSTLFNAYDGTFIYLSPIILLFPRNLLYVKKVIYVILILSVIYIIYSVLFIGDLLSSYDIQSSQNIVEYYSKTLSIPAGFLLLTYIYHSNKKNLFALCIILITFLFALYRARRALAFLAFWPLLITYIIYLNYSKSYFLKVLVFLFLASVLALGVAYFQTSISYLSDSSATSWFLDRVGEDTRSEVEEYFFRDLKPIDWIIGKGMTGKYYCPGIDRGLREVSIFRSGIETDYLTIILKGGIISLGLKLLMAIPAIIKGLFQSKNLLSKAAGTWILFYLIDLYPAPVTTFSLNYLLVWISIGICFSKELRDLPDEKIKEVLSG